MRIGIDGYEANVIQRVGIGRFAYELLWALYRLNTKHEIIIFIPNGKIADLPRERTNWQYRIVKSRRLWTFVSLPKALHKENLDIFFSPTHYVPLFSRIPRVFSIMDLSFIHFPKLFRKKDLHQLRLGTQYSAKVGKGIVTISNFSKDAIIKQYKAPSKSVVVAYPGFDHKVFNTKASAAQIKGVHKRFGITNDYIIYVGTLQPRKNIVRLLNAFQQLEDKKVKLLIVGKKGWLYSEFFEKVKKWKLSDRILFTNFVSDTDLALLLRGAKCFVLPSLYEGFGIPAVEAMACGVPVVVSNISSLPEIVGDAGIYVNPYESKYIASGLNQALSLSDAQRKAMIHKGLAQIQKFSWETCASTALEIIEKTYNDTI